MHTQKTQAVIEKLRQLPPERILEVENFIDFLRSRTYAGCRKEEKLQDFPVDHIGHWPEYLSLRREDIYGDDGR
ncbi:DUF2281 domain-containing protein [Halorhodospira halochloris]|uniref:DUF2281 domain-containing protein n=1 Tax=Halorhodospira halochloris TaxID=1052 RepID=A0A110B523_HALHR|nr:MULTISPECIES: hypothetical protein [Halorhodospira]MBK1652948.1 hypothetical protein [Halorhodospira halochloris]MBK5944789.1 hypothetical protein [Halorhodospira halophila]MCG5531633.1 DUF2281 domain-containing protein [Halorhodospira halochloris]MCG5548914.1 DUF2281 domain-containing protein [Halorhodospira halochloris]BAU57053.1 hypothetical protein HH1059_03760 [Halorhodospira halochloris]